MDWQRGERRYTFFHTAINFLSSISFCAQIFILTIDMNLALLYRLWKQAFFLSFLLFIHFIPFVDIVLCRESVLSIPPLLCSWHCSGLQMRKSLALFDSLFDFHYWLCFCLFSGRQACFFCLGSHFESLRSALCCAPFFLNISETCCNGWMNKWHTHPPLSLLAPWPVRSFLFPFIRFPNTNDGMDAEAVWCNVQRREDFTNSWSSHGDRK